jgi:hypothetical protein
VNDAWQDFAGLFNPIRNYHFMVLWAKRCKINKQVYPLSFDNKRFQKAEYFFPFFIKQIPSLFLNGVHFKRKSTRNVIAENEKRRLLIL